MTTSKRHLEESIQSTKAKKRVKRTINEDRHKIKQENKESLEEFLRKEEEFHLKQAKLRSQIRIRENRAKPADLIYNNLSLIDAKEFPENFKFEPREPHKILEGLSLKQLDEFIEDIRVHFELDVVHKEFWNAIMIVCEAIKKKELRKQDTIVGVHEAVREDVLKIFEGKSYSELCLTEKQIQEKISKQDSGIDIEYWESILNELLIYKAKALLKEYHCKIVNKYNEFVKNNKLEQSETIITTDNNVKTEEEEEEKNLTEEDMFRIACQNDEEGDMEFDDEIPLKQQKLDWADKWKPRKPKYYNRVHTGFEWNKYNQIHYDQNNPPPKIVQGYKFNIFYPDLIDKSKTPTYFIEPGDTKDTCIIRFHAGPPYEDIAFKIVNKDWERSHRKGFVATFERGILRLHFNFKKYRYRR